MASIHISDVRRFKECRQLWHYQSPLRLNLAPRRIPTYFLFGRLVHDGIEQYYSGARNPVKLYLHSMKQELQRLRAQDPQFAGSMDEAKLIEDLKIGKHVLHHYMLWAKVTDDFEMLHAEKRITLPLPGLDFKVSMRLDGVIRRGKSLWLKEFKTAKALPGDFSFLSLDEQASLYLWGARELHQEDVQGIVYTYLRKKAPAIPRRLKNKELSQAKNIDTTVVVYYNTLCYYKLDPEPYTNFLRFLAAKPNNFFKRYQVRRSRGELRKFMDQLKQVAEMMVDEDVLIYPAPDQMKCGRCSFFGPCSLAHSNPDMEGTLLKTNYMKNVWR